MVRLKLTEFSKGFAIYDKSQFHYGSIKTGIELDVETMKVLSQFHYGSIKTQGKQTQ